MVSNRGHQSIAVYKVHQKGAHRGELTCVGYFHTRGETPRHFQFDASGQYLLVANQDTDSLAVFNFNLSSGEIKYTGNEYRVPSPNFVCNCPMYDPDGDDVPEEQPEATSIIRSSLGAGASSDSEDSTSAVPRHPKKNPLEDELAMARREIEQLKEQLARLTPASSSVPSTIVTAAPAE